MLTIGGRTFYEPSDVPDGMWPAGRTATPTDPILAGQLGVAPILTTFLLTAATQQQAFAGPRLFPDITIPNVQVTIALTQGEELVSRDTARAAYAEMRLAKGRTSTFLAKVFRRTLGSPVDVDEVANAGLIDPGQRAVLISRAGIDLSIEVNRAAMIANAGNYAGTTALTSGNGWPTTGTMKANVDAAVAAIQAAVGLQRSQLSMALLGIGADNAARSDLNFLAKRLYTAGTPYPDLNAVRDYLGLKEVWSAAPVVKLTEAAAPTQLYADQAIIYYAGDPALLGGGSDKVGGLIWAGNPDWSAGTQALSPFYHALATTWIYPYQRWEGSHVFDNRLAYRFTGVSA